MHVIMNETIHEYLTPKVCTTLQSRLYAAANVETVSCCFPHETIWRIHDARGLHNNAIVNEFIYQHQ